MPTVEVCPSPVIFPATIRMAAAWVEALGNTPIVLAKEVQGFLINRIQATCLREALFLVEQGWASAETVDKAIVHSLGRRYAVTGLIESADLGELDVFSAVLDPLCPVLSKAAEASPLVREAIASGRLDAKSGQGIYNLPVERHAARLGERESHLVVCLISSMKQRDGNGGSAPFPEDACAPVQKMRGRALFPLLFLGTILATITV